MSILRSLDEVVGAVTDAAASADRIIVGIAGSPGAGKSTVGSALVERLGPDAQLVSMDGFHLPQKLLVELGRRDRMGAPDTFDVGGFVALLAELRFSGEFVLAPGFDRSIEEAIPDAVSIDPEKRIIVVEGNYLLHDTGGWEQVAPLLDLALFVTVPRDIRLARLIERHTLFGKSAADAAAWALGPDEVNAATVELTSERADHLVELG